MKSVRAIARLCAVTLHEALAQGVWVSLLLALLAVLCVRAFLPAAAEHAFGPVHRDLLAVAFAFFLWLVSLILPVALWRSELERDVFAMLFARGVRPWPFFAGRYLGQVAAWGGLWAAFWVVFGRAFAAPGWLALKFFVFANVMTFLACALGRAPALLTGVMAFALGHLQGLSELAGVHPASGVARAWEEVWSTVGPHFEFFDPAHPAVSERPAAVAAYALLYSAGCLALAFWCFRRKMMRAPCGSGHSL